MTDQGPEPTKKQLEKWLANQKAEYVPVDNDNVNHPQHYSRSPVEVIDIIRDLITTAYGLDGFKAYCWGNELKYRMRAGLKGDPAEDINKAMKYMEFREGLTGE